MSDVVKTMSETKMNKTRRCAGTLRASIRLKCNFIFTIKKILLFQPISNSPCQSFLEPIRPKRDNKMVNDSLKKKKKAVASETSGEMIVTLRIRTKTTNQTPYQSNSHSNTTTDGLELIGPCHTLCHNTNPVAQERLTPTLLLTCYLAEEEGPYNFYSFKINGIKSIPRVRCLLQPHAYLNRNKRASRNYSNDSIIEIGQNTKKNLRDTRGLAVIQCPVENHLLTLV